VTMGNVIAASTAPPPPPPPPSPGLMPNLGKQDSSAGVFASNETPSQIENPGTIEDLHKKCKGISRSNTEFPSAAHRFYAFPCFPVLSQKISQ